MTLQPVHLYIHVGPHKTATTTLQNVFDTNREVLERHGFLYPSSPHPLLAHHHVPFLLKGWSLERLGLVEAQISLEEAINSWFLEISMTDANNLLVSAEDFSVLTFSEWTAFGEHLLTGAQNAGISLDNLTILYTERSLTSRADSVYQEALKHGLAIERTRLEPSVERLLQNSDAALQEAKDQLGFPVHVKFVAFEDPNNLEQSFVHRWFSLAINEEIYEQLQLSTDRSRMNEKMPPAMQTALLEFNQLNSPGEQGQLRPLNDPNEVANRAWQRLRRYFSLLSERDQALSERDQALSERDQALSERNQALSDRNQALSERDQALSERDQALSETAKIWSELAHVYSSRSWTLTKPLRALRRRF